MVRNKKKVNEEQWNGRNRDQAKIFQDLIGKTGNGWDNIEHLFDL